MVRLDDPFHKSHIPSKEWPVEVTDEFVEWWGGLAVGERESVASHIGLLRRFGPNLPFPYTSAVRGPRKTALRELRLRHGRRRLRVLYAFDPRRVAVLLLGGDKTGRKDWYGAAVPKAERLFANHLAQLRREGLVNG